MAQRTPQQAVCMVCEEEKVMYARGGCYVCYRTAALCGTLDSWLPRKTVSYEQALAEWSRGGTLAEVASRLGMRAEALRKNLYRQGVRR